MPKYEELYDKLKNRVSTFSVQIPHTFERNKQVKVGGIYKGVSPYVDKTVPEKLVEIALDDGTSDFSVVTLEKEFFDGVMKENVSPGDIIICDGVMTDLIDGQKIVVISSVEKM